MFSKKYDFVAIGDITTDAFIRLKEAKVYCDIDNTNCKISMNFADKIPYEFVEVVKAVGNSANASVAGARLGLSSALVSDLGKDQNGNECLAELKKNNVSTTYVSRHKTVATNYHYVLWYEAERTILVKHNAYPYALPHIAPPKWLYVSSIGGNSETYHEQIMDYVDAHPEMNVAFQPGTFQMKLGVEKLKRLYARTHVFVCNVEESKRILGTSESDIKKLLLGIATLGPKIVAITDGPKGAYLYDGAKSYFMRIYPDPKQPLERTGAGDAFASTFVSALALGKTPLEALRIAPVNSMSVVQYVGAQKGLLTMQEIEGWLAKAPADYTAKEI
ncbi:MAG: carbohydrate kinase family protein [Patescibacteria group bacterium]